MRIIIVSLTLVFLSACGTNQTEQMSKSEPLVKKDESQVVMEKPAAGEMSESMASSENNMTNQNVEDLKVEEANGEAGVEVTSDNSMIKDTGVVSETQSTETMDAEQKDIAKEKETTDKQVVDQKG